MAYRDDLAALSAQRNALHEALAEKGDGVRELVERLEVVNRRLHRHRLHVLSSARVASPCSARWDAMVGDERVRRCSRCDKHVYDVSELDAEEVLELFERTRESLCVRLYRRRDGTVMTADCPTGRHQSNVRAAVLAVGVALGSAALAEEAPWDEPLTLASEPIACDNFVEIVMGEVAIGDSVYDHAFRLDEDVFFGRSGAVRGPRLAPPHADE